MNSFTSDVCWDNFTYRWTRFGGWEIVVHQVGWNYALSFVLPKTWALA